MKIWILFLGLFLIYLGATRKYAQVARALAGR